MEELLALYALLSDPQYPIICLDERPSFLIGDKVAALAIRSGKVAKEHYAYEKHGSCTLFTAIEPLTDWRLAQVHTRRTKQEYTHFCLALAAEFPAAF